MFLSLLFLLFIFSFTRGVSIQFNLKIMPA